MLHTGKIKCLKGNIPHNLPPALNDPQLTINSSLKKKCKVIFQSLISIMGTTETFKPVHRFIPKPVPNVTILLKSPFFSRSKIRGGGQHLGKQSPFCV